ncbi:n/a [Ectocarpus siliculosus]|uniref:N/a n=1 Tax=Ectocarpus siliculosus TaxID=2880 RepID=D8LP59_ECTSI|nr:n/a [Ectocarpus siliculosus]|eukprot:CBN80330.1 n/a [Ectocarpus siliculosus]
MDHLSCRLERRLWECRDDEHFWTNIPRAAKKIYEAAGQKTPERALPIIRKFVDQKRGSEKELLRPEWGEAMEHLLSEYRGLFEPLRVKRPPPKDPPEHPKTEEELTGREDFLYNVKARLNDVLRIEAGCRKVDFHLRKRRGEIWSEINERQQSIKSSKTKEGFLKQRHLLQEIPVPPWFDEGIKMSKKDASNLVRDVRNTRKDMWKSMREPGTEDPPKAFSLMPHFSLTRAFVRYDSQSIGTLAKSLDFPGVSENQVTLKTTGVKCSGKAERLWWTGIFDFHSERIVNRRPSTEKNQTQRTRKVLRLNNRYRKGIGVCNKDPWFTDEVLYSAKRDDPSCETPWIVNSISTDGLQVKVCLATLAKTNPLPKGVKELVKKGYASIQDKLRVSKSSKGVFKEAFPLYGTEKSRLSSPDNHIEVVGLDPGQVSVYATVRANITSPKTFEASEFKGSQSSISSREYKHQSLTRFSAKAEVGRRLDHVEYGQAVQAFDSVSLKQPGSSVAYSSVIYCTLRVRVVELLSEERRLQKFARLRARQRTVDGMARDIAFGNTYKQEVRKEQRSSAEPLSPERRKELLKKIRDKKRVVFFGNGQFGHGARGACPRKALIRALGVLCPVVLVDEFRTSKCCCSCGVPLKQVDGSRVFRCSSQMDEGQSCSVKFIDRDTNGSANIGVCGVFQLLGLKRPSFLCRKSSEGK